jgi:pimeloyl-ACP methyl ester carboxylesterase
MDQAIIIIGGYNSVWTAYLKMARELENLTGLRAVGVPLLPWHWWSAAQAEDATITLRKVQGTVCWAQRKLGARRLILVGHSAGGLIGRLYLSEQPIWGTIYGGAEHVSELITLGSPHCAEQSSKVGWYLADEANRLSPGATYPGLVGYRAVAGRYCQGRENGNWKERRSFRNYSFFGGRGDAWGDGVVPVASAVLAGTDSLVLEGIAHSRKYGPNWYGATRAIIRSWWPDRAAGDP